MTGPAQGTNRALLVVGAIALASFGGNAATGWLAMQQQTRLTGLTENVADREQRTKDLEVELEEVRSAANGLQGRLENNRRERDALVAELATVRSETLALNGTLADQRARLTKTASELEGRIATLKSSEDKLDKALEAEVHKRKQLETSLAEAKAAQDRLQKRVRATESQLAKTRDQAKELQAALSESEAVIAALRKAGINVERRAGLSIPPELTATVVKVQGDRIPPLIVLDVGSAQKIEVDDVVFVRRDGRKIAEARIERVTETKSVARITDSAANVSVKEGDQATTRTTGSS